MVERGVKMLLRDFFIFRPLMILYYYPHTPNMPNHTTRLPHLTYHHPINHTFFPAQIQPEYSPSQLFTSGLLGLSRLTQHPPIQHHLLYHLYRRIGRPQLFHPLWISRNYLPSTQRPHYHYLPLSPQRVIPSRNLCHHHLPPLPSTHHPPPTDHLCHRQLEHMPHPKHPSSLSLSPLHH